MYLTQNQFQTQVVTVSPLLAKQWLGKNLENNRKLSPLHIKKLANLMTQGEWKIGEPIKFDKYDNLIDGQHRLSAVITANMSVEFLIVYGYETESAQVLDRGKSRNLQDIANLKNLNLTSRQISIFSFMITPSFYPKLMTPRIELLFTPEERIDLTLSHLEAIKFGNTVRSGPNKLVSVTLAGVLARAYYCCPTKDLKDFVLILQGHLDKVYTRKSLTVVQKLVTKFQLKDWASNSTGHGISSQQIAVCQFVLHSFLNNKSPRKLIPVFENLFPVPELDLLAQQKTRENINLVQA